MTRSFLLLRTAAFCCSWLLSVHAFAGRYSSGKSSYSSGGRSSSSSSFSSTRSSSSSGSPSAGRSSYSSGSFNRSSSSAGSFSNAQPAAPLPSRAPYSTGGSSYNGTRPTSVPNASGYDAAAARARAVQNSSQNFTNSKKSSAPQPTGNAGLSPAPPPVQAPRPRSPRLQAYNTRPVVYYRDRYDPMFWWWLMDQSRPVRAQWVYHHYSDADPQRITALQQADPALDTEVEALKNQQIPVNSEFAPDGLPAEEMYRDQPDPPAEGDRLPVLDSTPEFRQVSNFAPRPSTGGGSWLVLLVCSTFMGWLIFFKRWKTASA